MLPKSKLVSGPSSSHSYESANGFQKLAQSPLSPVAVGVSARGTPAGSATGDQVLDLFLGSG